MALEMVKMEKLLLVESFEIPKDTGLVVFKPTLVLGKLLMLKPGLSTLVSSLLLSAI